MREVLPRVEIGQRSSILGLAANATLGYVSQRQSHNRLHAVSNLWGLRNQKAQTQPKAHLQVQTDPHPAIPVREANATRECGDHYHGRPPEVPMNHPVE